MLKLLTMAAIVVTLGMPQIGRCAAICPTTIENDPPVTSDGCGILLTVNSNLDVSIALTGTGAYDGASSSTFGVVNNSGTNFASLSVNGGGAGITFFAGNGIRTYISANGVSIPPLGPILIGYEDYYGPRTIFSDVDPSIDSLTIHFTGSLLSNSSTYFSLPGDPETDFSGLAGPSGSVFATPTTTETPEGSSWTLVCIGLLFFYLAKCVGGVFWAHC
jgi:hypothetical protein